MTKEKTEKECRQELFRLGSRKVSDQELDDWKFYCFVFVRVNEEETIDEVFVCGHVDRMRELRE